jgi:predicted nuclease of predicted toxin-antitoxin system
VKILLDECIDQRLAKQLSGYEVKTVPQAGWAGIKDGELLRLAEGEFDVLIPKILAIIDTAPLRSQKVWAVGVFWLIF